MHKAMFDIELSTDESDPIVYIDQKLPHQERGHRVLIHLDQIEALMGWLRDAKTLLEARRELG